MVIFDKNTMHNVKKQNICSFAGDCSLMDVGT
jgi:hypothetical protein